MGGYEHDTGKVRISALTEITTRDEVQAIADKESRTFSLMVSILLAEAIEARKALKNRK